MHQCTFHPSRYSVSKLELGLPESASTTSTQVHFTLLHTLMLYYSIEFSPLTVAITLSALKKSAKVYIYILSVEKQMYNVKPSYAQTLMQ